MGIKRKNIAKISRKYLILDLDQTLLHSYTPKEYEKKKKQIKKYDYEKMLGDNNKTVLYYVVKRPGLDNFIKRMLKKYTILIWTAATQSYGVWIVHNILPTEIKKQKIVRKLSNGEYHLLLHNDHGNRAQEKMRNNINKSSKPLEYMYSHPSYKKYLNKYNTVLIDDASHVEMNQRLNVIKIPEFHVKGTFDNIFTKKNENQYIFDKKIEKKFDILKNRKKNEEKKKKKK